MNSKVHNITSHVSIEIFEEELKFILKDFQYFQILGVGVWKHFTNMDYISTEEAIAMGLENKM